MSFKIVTDSSANLRDDQIENYELDIISLSYFVGDREYIGYQRGVATDYETFYSIARSKSSITTSQASYEQFENIFVPLLERGEDILYIGFSSALSGTFQMSKTVAADLAVKYPERKIICVDSLCASMGQGLLVHYAVMQKRAGADIEEIAKWLEDNKLNLVHWFTVDDLFFLKRGGRVSGAVAIAGTILGIKPVMHVDDMGRLTMVEKARGRKAALNSLVNHMEKSAVNPKEQTIFISHGDCLEDAEYVKEEIVKRFGVKNVEINYVDPVIGAHSGPGTVALFFIGQNRN